MIVHRRSGRPGCQPMYGARRSKGPRR